MSTLPTIAKTRDAAASLGTRSGESSESRELTAAEAMPPALSGSPFPFFSFSYSFNEVTLVDGQTRVRSHQMRLVDGKLQTEEFDGTFDGAAYARAVAETQNLLAEQTAFFLRQFSHFLPFWGK